MPGLRLSYWNPRLLRTVFFQLQQQQQTGLFCDVTLQGDGEGIHVHSCVIAACSPYLANMLMCPTEISEVSDPKTPISSSRHVIWIHGIKSLHLIPLVHYMYTSELEVAPADVSDVLKAAQKLQIPELELLKLEAGRLVKNDAGRRLNRNCLGSKAYTPYAKAVKQVKVGNQGILNPCTPIEIDPARDAKNKIVNDVTSVILVDREQSNENTLDIETSRCGTSDNWPSNLDVLDSIFGSGSSLEDLVNSPEYLENVPSSHDLLQHVLGNQSSQQDAPPSHNSKEDVADSQDLIENTLNSQDYVQDVISNQNSAIHVARRLDLTKCKLKGSLDCVPSHQHESKTVEIYGFPDTLQCSQDSIDNMQGIVGLSENMQSVGELPEDGPGVGELPEDGPGVGELPEDGPGVGELPEDGPGVGELPEDGPGVGELPEDGPGVGELPEDGPGVGELPEDGPGVGELPEDGPGVGELPEDGPGVGELPEDGPGVGELPEDGPGVGELPEDGPGVGESPEDGPGVGESPEDGPGVGESPEDGPGVGESPEDGPGVGESPEDGPGVGESPEDGPGVGESPEDGPGVGESPEDGPGVGESPEDGPGSRQLPEDGQCVGESPEDGQCVGESPEDGQCVGESPEDGQCVGESPEDGQCVGESPEDGQSSRQLPEDGQSSRQLPEDGQSSRELPEDEQCVGELPEDGQCVGKLPEDGQSSRELPEDGQSSRELPEDEQCVGKSPEDGQCVGKSPEDGQSSRELPEDEQCVGKSPEDGQCVGKSPEDGQSSRELPEDWQSSRELPEDGQSSRELPGCGQGIGDLPGVVEDSEGLPENGLRGQNTQKKSQKRCRTTLYKHNKRNPEVKPTQERKCFVEGQQSRNHATSRKGLLKRIRRDRKNEVFELLNLKSSVSTEADICSKIDISVSETSEKHDLFNLINPCLSEDGLGDHQSSEKNVFYKDDWADPLVSDANVNSSVPHTSLEGIKMTEMKNNTVDDMDCSSTYCESKTSGTVDPGGLTPSAHGDHKTSVYVYNKSIDESKKRKYNLGDSLKKDVEKMKLRKVNSELSWEIVREVESLNIMCPSKGREHLTESEEQVQQILNVTPELSPDIDVGVYSPPMFLEAYVWPDLSSDSDMEIDIVG